MPDWNKNEALSLANCEGLLKHGGNPYRAVLAVFVYAVGLPATIFFFIAGFRQAIGDLSWNWAYGGLSLAQWNALSLVVIVSVFLLLSKLAHAADQAYSAGAVEPPPRVLRRNAKLANERLKLIASGLNALGASALLAIAVVPAVQTNGHFQSVNITIGLLTALSLHLVGQFVLSRWRSEE